MKRVKRHKIKQEMPHTSTSRNSEQEQHDLAYYIHDRVELMHQVFSVLKSKELKGMVPACIRNISLGDLQELCTEELLGISSKRLCAILDGAEPPSDTESSSPSPEPELETISLDSISSDDDLLSQSSKKKKHKHRRLSKSKHKKGRDKADKSGKGDKGGKDKQSEGEGGEGAGGDAASKATRAGLTVLELLELQARARAIRAQLQQEQKNKAQSSSVAAESPPSSDGEVQIKEEPAEVVEISSEDEKPNIQDLLTKTQSLKEPEVPPAAVKHINNLVITVPQTPTRKIKLNRKRSTVTQLENNSNREVKTAEAAKEVEKPKDVLKEKQKEKIKKKKKQKKSASEVKEGSDNDEITLQLSDTEKMDLLEDLDRKNLDYVSSDSESSSETESEKESGKDGKSEDSPIKVASAPETTNNTVNGESNLENSEVATNLHNNDDSVIETHTNVTNNSSIIVATESVNSENSDTNEKDARTAIINTTEINDDPVVVLESTEKDVVNSINKDSVTDDKRSDSESLDQNVKTSDLNLITSFNSDNICLPNKTGNGTENNTTEVGQEEKCKTDQNIELTISYDVNGVNIVPNEEIVNSHELSSKQMSDGELSDRESSEVEAMDLKPEVVCISDEETSSKAKKKKKKKDKKAKKEKKSKNKSDFHESADQNFYKERVVTKIDKEGDGHKKFSITISNSTTQENNSSSDNPPVEIDETDLRHTLANKASKTPDSENNIDLTVDKATELTNDDTETYKKENTCRSIDNKCIIGTTDVIVKKRNTALSESSIDDDVYEILELSDDSSCYEVEGILSKEPTTQEIEALSAKIDNIERVEVITEEEIREYEKEQIVPAESEEIEQISWKDRYLDSKKVKTVLNTSNILNALRKKNIELKKKLEASKIAEKLEETKMAQKDEEESKESSNEEATTAEGTIDQYNTLESCTKYVDPVKEDQIHGSLKKDAKQLLKMYKKLLKYNDMNKKKDPDKKKKKKKRKKSVDKVQNET